MNEMKTREKNLSSDYKAKWKAKNVTDLSDDSLSLWSGINKCLQGSEGADELKNERAEIYGLVSSRWLWVYNNSRIHNWVIIERYTLVHGVYERSRDEVFEGGEVRMWVTVWQATQI